MAKIPEINEALEELEIIIGSNLSTQSAKTTLDISATIATLTATGASNQVIRNILLNDLNSGGVIFGTYRNAIKNTVGASIQMAGSVASRGKFGDEGIAEFRWVTAKSGNTCEDCEPRHNEIQTYEQWQVVGLPQSGFSVCNQYCNCILVPKSYKGEKLEKSIDRRKRVKELRRKYRA
jgi:hypothetical protein